MIKEIEKLEDWLETDDDMCMDVTNRKYLLKNHMKKNL